MIAIDNTALLAMNACNCVGFAPAVNYVYDSSAKTVTFKDLSVASAGDAVKRVNVSVFDEQGNKASGSMSTGGSGYTSAPTVSFSGGGGSGAAGTAVLTNGVVTSVTITNAGSGYTSAPTVAFSGGGGSGAAGTVVLSGATVGSITIGSTTGAIDISGLDATKPISIKATVSTNGGCVSDGSARGIAASGSLGNWDRDFTSSETGAVSAPAAIS